MLASRLHFQVASKIRWAAAYVCLVYKLFKDLVILHSNGNSGMSLEYQLFNSNYLLYDLPLPTLEIYILVVDAIGCLIKINEQ